MIEIQVFVISVSMMVSDYCSSFQLDIWRRIGNKIFIILYNIHATTTKMLDMLASILYF